MSISTHPKITNSVLRALSPKNSQDLLAHSKQVNLVCGDVLCEPGTSIRHVYFPNNGIISLLTPVYGNKSVEVGLVGREGMAGIELILGVGTSPLRMVVQAAGTATRMNAASFRVELKRNLVFKLELNKYLLVFFSQVWQTAACNRHHKLKERLARRLLMTLDRMQSTDFYLTQELLAQVLGVRRVGVTKAAGLLQRHKLIRYSRGHITILDRKGLIHASCRCYGTVNNICESVLGDHHDRA